MNEDLLSWIDTNVDKYAATADLFQAARQAFPKLNAPELAIHLRESGRRAFAHAAELRGYPAANQH